MYDLNKNNRGWPSPTDISDPHKMLRCKVYLKSASRICLDRIRIDHPLYLACRRRYEQKKIRG